MQMVVLPKRGRKIMGVEKYIDLEQFPKTKEGRISWKDSVGLVIDFTYDGEHHSFKITGHSGSNCVSGVLDGNIVIDKIPQVSVKKAMFNDYLCGMKPFYEIGQIINEKIMILDYYAQEAPNRKKRYIEKYYKCKCVIDGYEWTATERGLKSGHGCHVCTNNATLAGYNDVETLRPDLVKYFANKSDVNKYSPFSGKEVNTKCPECGHERMMKIARMSQQGFHCPICSDSVSYPNKFARNLFNQISSQYQYYKYEYSPDWAGKYRYDNYIILNDGTRLIIEMDGGQHYLENCYFNTDLDEVKNNLAREHGITMIRVNCAYGHSSDRFDYIKKNVLESLSQYFVLDAVDWNAIANGCKTSDFILTIEEYNKNIDIRISDLAKTVNLSFGVVLKYLNQGNKLGLCTYEKGMRVQKPVESINLLNGDIVLYKSAKDFALAIGISTNESTLSAIRKYAKNNCQYKNYILRYATHREYEEFVKNQQSA